MPVLTHPHARWNFPTRSLAFRTARIRHAPPPYSALPSSPCSVQLSPFSFSVSFSASSSSRSAFSFMLSPEPGRLRSLGAELQQPSLDRRLAELPEADHAIHHLRSFFFFL